MCENKPSGNKMVGMKQSNNQEKRIIPGEQAEGISSTASPGKMVVVDIKKDKTKRLFTKNRIIGGFSVAVIVIAVGALMYVRHQNSLESKREQDTILQDTATYENAQKKVKELRAKREYESAIQAAYSYVDTAVQKDKAAFLLVDVGAIYEILGDTKAALDTYLRAESLAGEGVYGISRGIARTSFQLGDNSTALIYYKKALADLEANDSPANKMTIDSLKRIIEGIEAMQ